MICSDEMLVIADIVY